MFNTYEDIALEVARLVRESEAKVKARIASRQLGEAWVGIPQTEKKAA